MGCHALPWGNLPNPGIEPRSPGLHAGSLPFERLGRLDREETFGSLCVCSSSSIVCISSFVDWTLDPLAVNLSIVFCESFYELNLSGLGHSKLKQLPLLGFPGGSDGKESTCNAGDLGSISASGRSPWRRKWQPTPVFLPGECYGQRSLVGYSP